MWFRVPPYLPPMVEDVGLSPPPSGAAKFHRTALKHLHLEVRQPLWAENHKLGGMWQRHSQHCCLISVSMRTKSKTENCEGIS
ncbi:hypothetical protein Nmel_007626 [Mimus melanotis]